MKKDIFTKKTYRLIGLLAFIATGGGLIISTAVNESNFYKTEILIIFGAFFALSLADHYQKLREKDEKHEG